MSNLLKSKFVLGFMVTAFAMTGLMMNANTAKAATCDLGTTTMRVGSHGTNVSCLQTILSITADGSFGKGTKAAVMTFQAANNLTADGVVGAMSRAALSGTAAPVVTGATCPNGMLLSNNCMAPAASNEALCPNGMTLASNCMTGASTVSTSGEGSVTVTMESSPSNGTEIAYDTTKSTMALKVKATGADMSVNRVDFNFNKRAWLYVNKAALYDGSTMVAEKTLSSNSFDQITVGTDYRLRFDGLNVVVAKDATKVLTLKLTAPSIITDPNTLVMITVDTNSVRASDGTGLVSYEGVSGTRTFKVKTATAGSLVASLDTATPAIGTVAVDDVDNTEGVSLLIADLKATGDAVHVTSIPVVMTVAVTTGTTSTAEVVDSVYLYKDGAQIASATYAADCDDASDHTCTVTFSDLDETIAKDATAKYTVKATLKPIDGTIVTANDTVQATMTIGSIVAEDGGFDTVTATGSSVGLAQHMFVTAPQLTFVSATSSMTAGDATAPVQPILTGTVVFKVKAVGGTIYLNKADTTTAGKRALLNGDGGIDMVAADTLTSTTYSISGVSAVSDGTDSYYTITDGNEVTVTATGYVTSLTPSGLQQVRIEGLKWGTVATNETTRSAQTSITWGLDDFHTTDALLAFY